MAHTDTIVSTLKINRGTYANIQSNLSSIGENELIITTDKGTPVPTASDSGKVISVNSSGEYELITPSSGMTNPMTTEGDIIYGASSGTPTRLAKGTQGQVLTMGASYPQWANAASGITEISTQYVRITDLNAGVYKLTYNDTKYIYYYGTTNTSYKHTVTGGAGAVILIISRYSTTYWHWWYINGTSSYFASLYYGYTSASSGSWSSKVLNDIRTQANASSIFHYNSDFKNTSSYTVPRYQLLIWNGTGFSAFTSTDNTTATTKTQLDAKYYPGGHIFYCNKSTTTASNSTFSGDLLYPYYYIIDLRYSFNITTSTLTSKNPVYIKMSKNNDGSLSPVYSSSSGGHPLVQALPNSADGYVYVYIGVAYDGYRMDLELDHPCYEYVDGKIQLYTGQSGGGTSVTITDLTV